MRLFMSGELFVSALIAIGNYPVKGEIPSFKRFDMGSQSARMAQNHLVDVDGDGDLDFTSGSKESGGFWWWEYKSDDNWTQHLVGNSNADVCGRHLDVDNDGDIDLTTGSNWFENKDGKGGIWEKHSFAGIGKDCHDRSVVDINGDGRLDVVSLGNSNFEWHDPANGWAKHNISGGMHGGVNPHGFGDLDGDGRHGPH